MPKNTFVFSFFPVQQLCVPPLSETLYFSSSLFKVKRSPKCNLGLFCKCIWVKPTRQSIITTKEPLLRFTIFSFSGQTHFQWECYRHFYASNTTWNFARSITRVSTHEHEHWKHCLCTLILLKRTFLVNSVPLKNRAWNFCTSHLISLSSAAGMSPLYTPFQEVTGVTGASPSYLCGERQGTPWTSRQLSAGPLLMAQAATQLHIRSNFGSLSCSRILRHAAQLCPRGAEIQTSNLPITSTAAV